MPTKLIITGKNQLTQTIAQKTKLPQSKISQIIDELLIKKQKALFKGEEVSLQRKFSLKTAITKPRMAKSIQFKKNMKNLIKRLPKTKLSITLKEKMSKSK